MYEFEKHYKIFIVYLYKQADVSHFLFAKSFPILLCHIWFHGYWYSTLAQQKTKQKKQQSMWLRALQAA